MAPLLVNKLIEPGNIVIDVKTGISGAAVLAEMEKGKVGGNVRDPERYFVSVFGTPGGAEPWGWRVEGHHLSVNFTINFFTNQFFFLLIKQTYTTSNLRDFNLPSSRCRQKYLCVTQLSCGN